MTEYHVAQTSSAIDDVVASHQLSKDDAYEFSKAPRLLVSHVGKRNSLVTTQVPYESRDALNNMVKKRELCGVPPSNPYLFGKPNSATTYFQGWYAIT